MKRPPRFVFVALSLLTATILLYSAIAVRAIANAPSQSQAGGRTVTVRGTVTDQSGAAVPNSRLTFAAGDISVDTRSGGAGAYTVTLATGLYKIHVESDGFGPIDQTGVEIKPGSDVRLDFLLKVMTGHGPVYAVTVAEPTPPPIATKLSDSSAAATQNSAYPPQYASIKTVQAGIPMKDGVRLAVNLYMPDGPLPSARPGEKFPAILEYLPYRKDDWTLARDWDLHSYFIRRGYVTARVDIRGTGASEGVPPDREYSDQEQQDGLEVIAWLAKQPWSNGNVGMTGISWGGFNSIQIARLHPPALKAIIAMCATEELFHDDIHYIDNLMHLDEFELGMDLQLGLTRAPDFPTDEKSLATRFDAKPWAFLYLEHQRDSEFWRRASVAPNHYDEYTVPSFMIGGFLDGYRDSIPRFFEHSKAPIKALIGPWNHTFPHEAEPGPSIEWRVEAVRWWDYWLKGIQNGIMDEPRFEVYMRHWYPPDPNIAEIPGEWRAEKTWPPANTSKRTFFLQPNYSLGDAPPPALSIGGHQLQYVPSIGSEAGFWWGDLTADQRPIDAYSLVYDSAPLVQDTAILGWPKAFLQVSSSAPLADWFVRLSDVAPDGTVTLITGAGQSGAQRDSAAIPSDLEADRKYSLPIELHVTSWVFPAGHRIRSGDFECAVADDLAHSISDDDFSVARRPEHFAPGTSARSAGAACASSFQRARKRNAPRRRDHRRRHLAAAELDRHARCVGRFDARRMERRRFQRISLGKIERSRTDELRRGGRQARSERSARRRVHHHRTARPHAGLERRAESAQRRAEFLLSFRTPSDRKWKAAARQNLGGNNSA